MRSESQTPCARAIMSTIWAAKRLGSARRSFAASVSQRPRGSASWLRRSRHSGKVPRLRLVLGVGQPILSPLVLACRLPAGPMEQATPNSARPPWRIHVGGEQVAADQGVGEAPAPAGCLTEASERPRPGCPDHAHGVEAHVGGEARKNCLSLRRTACSVLAGPATLPAHPLTAPRRDAGNTGGFLRCLPLGGDLLGA